MIDRLKLRDAGLERRIVQLDATGRHLGIERVAEDPAVGGQLSANVAGQVLDPDADHHHGRQSKPDGRSGHHDPVDRYGPGVVVKKCLNARHGLPS